MAAILTLTLNPALDLTTETEVLAPTRKLRCSTPHAEPGGGGVNVSRAIRELGGTSRALIALGGSTGARHRELLEAEGIETRVFPLSGETRFSLTVMASSANTHYRFVMPGPQLDAADAERLFDGVVAEIDSARYLVCSGSLPPGLPLDTYRRIAAYCRDIGVAVCLDSSGPALSETLKARPFLVRLNHLEAGDLVNADTEDALTLADRLHERGAAEVVIVTHGANGAAVVSPDVRLLIVPPRVRPRSTVGAGDSFMAALVLGLSLGWSLEKAARFGVAAAASAVTTPATALCRNASTHRYLERTRVERLAPPLRGAPITSRP